MSDVADKPRWVELTDPDEAVALVQGGKFDDSRPTWIRRSTSIWVRVDQVFKAWRENRSGKAT